MEKEVIFDQQAFLDMGAERSRKFHVLKFRVIMDRLVVEENEGLFKQSRTNFMPVLQGLKAAELLAHGTDFFWSSVHRVFNALDAGNEMIEIMYGIFLQNAFDAFFALLPAGSSLFFKNYGDDQVTLIALGITVESFLDQYILLQKTGKNDFSYGYVKDLSFMPVNMVTIDIANIPHFQRVKMAVVGERTQVLFQRHQVLFESAYHYECNPSVYLGQLFYPRLQQAFDLIRRSDEKLYNQITGSLDFIVPLAKPGASNHPSFASALLKRTIFLSLDLLETNDYYLAECIIHEFSHCQLYKVQDTILLTQTDLIKRYYYSPWRTDPRHLLGLTHGIFVFSRVISFYRDLLQKNFAPAEQDWFEKQEAA